MTYLYIAIGLLTISYSIAFYLMKVRDNINVTTHTGKLKAKKYNQLIDILTGYWIWSFSLGKK